MVLMAEVSGIKEEVAMSYPIRYGGRLFETTGVEVTSTSVIFTLPNNTFLYSAPCGIVPIHIKQDIPSGTTQTLPIMFKINNETQSVVLPNGTSLTAAGITSGVYLFFYDKRFDVLQIIGVNS